MHNINTHAHHHVRHFQAAKAKADAKSKADAKVAAIAREKALVESIKKKRLKAGLT